MSFPSYPCEMTTVNTCLTMFHAMVYCRPNDHGQSCFKVKTMINLL